MNKGEGGMHIVDSMDYVLILMTTNNTISII